MDVATGTVDFYASSGGVGEKDACVCNQSLQWNLLGAG
jgi:hypothetical protein